MPPEKPNRLYFGDCLEVLREDVADATVDLIYLDPPFNSKPLYNAFIGDAQWVAFDDTWRWHEAEDDFHDVAREPGALADTLEGLRTILGEGPNLAYLSYMANRLRECRRVLKPTGSLYLHCDPTMSHPLKLVLDAVFGTAQFQNEIIWHYRKWSTGTHAFQRNHDTIFYYRRARQGGTFNQTYMPRARSTVKRFGEGKIVSGFDPAGRRVPSTTSGTSAGVRQDDVWDIARVAPVKQIYPTEKPLRLLKRIVNVSSNPGDVVLDPFCGCGTTIHAAHLIGRQWVGIDVCVTACQTIEKRMREHFDSLWDDVEFVGMPKTANDAKTLASMDKFRFERWAVSLVDGMEANPRNRQRGDGGIDGRGRLAIRKGRFIDMISQAKGGSTNPSDVRDLIGTRQKSKADIGIFTCFEDRVTRGMRDTAASVGRFMDVPAVQIYTIEDFFAGRKPEMPVAV